jgi:hypothetical protein
MTLVTEIVSLYCAIIIDPGRGLMMADVKHHSFLKNDTVLAIKHAFNLLLDYLG